LLAILLVNFELRNPSVRFRAFDAFYLAYYRSALFLFPQGIEHHREHGYHDGETRQSPGTAGGGTNQAAE